MLWTCPICRTALADHDRYFACDNTHSFDVSKQGHLNLLPAHHKRSKQPGDTRAMLTARRRFLQAGHYRPLVELLGLTLTEGRWLDLGCGEGYYSRSVDGPDWWALDIAKDGVSMAAKLSARARCVVASAVNVPMNDEQLDGVLTVFAPTYEAEVVRLLKPGGRLIWVGPGPGHLAALAAAVYDEPKAHESAPPVHAQLKLLETEDIRFDLSLTPAEQADLLLMTPYAWSASEAKTQAIGEKAIHGLHAEFSVRVYTRV